MSPQMQTLQQQIELAKDGHPDAIEFLKSVIRISMDMGPSRKTVIRVAKLLLKIGKEEPGE